MMDAKTTNQTLTPALRAAIAATAAIDLLIGLAFLLGPELRLALWPTPIPLALMRFIGAIVLANGVGALMIVRRPTWENARTLFTVALVYGIVVLIALLYQLLLGAAAPIFWIYIAVDAIFLIPICYIFWIYERGSAWRQERALSDDAPAQPIPNR
jgi:hypothetical protein